MPDNNIKANINVNMQSNVKEQTQLIIAQYNGVKEAIEGCMNNPLSNTDSEIKEIGKALGQLHNNVSKLSINEVLSPEKIQAVSAEIAKLEESYKGLKNITKEARDTEFEALAGNMNKSWDKLEDTINKALNNPLGISESKLEKINNEINTFTNNINNVSKYLSFDEFFEASDILSVYKKKLDLIIDTKDAFSSFKDTLSETKYLINSYKINPQNFDVSSITNNIDKLKNCLDQLELVMNKEQYYKFKSSIDDITNSFEKQVQAIEKVKEEQALSGLDEVLKETEKLDKEMAKLDESELQRLAKKQQALADYRRQALSGLDEVLKETEKLDKEMQKLDETELQRLAKKQMALAENEKTTMINAPIIENGLMSKLAGNKVDNSLLDDITLLSREMENGLKRIKNELDEISTDRVYINTEDAIQDLKELEQSLINTKQVLETQLANGDIDFSSYAQGVKQVNELYEQLRKIATDNGFVKASEDVDKFNAELEKTINEVNGVEESTKKTSEENDIALDKYKEKFNALKYVLESVKLNPDELGKINIEKITGNIDELKKQLNELKDSMSPSEYYNNKLALDKMSKSFEELNDKTGNTSKILGIAGNKFNDLLDSIDPLDLVIKGVKKGFDEFDKTLREIIKSAGDAGIALGEGFVVAVESVGELLELLEQASSKIKEFADAGVDLNKKYFILSRTLGTNGAASTNGVLGKISAMYGLNADNLIDGFNSINLTLSKMGANIEDVSGAFTNMTLNLSAASGEDFNTIASKLQSAITMGYLGQNSIIARTLLKNDEERKAFKELNSEVERAQFLFDRAGRANGAMAAYMNTAAGKVEQMNQSFSILNSNVQRLAVGIMSKLAPVIIAVTNLVNRLVVALAKLLNIDMEGFDQNFEGISYDSSSLSENLDKVSDGIDSVSDSANKAKKNLASFDDVIQINDNSSDLSDVGDLADNLDDLSGLGGSLDLSDFNLDIEESNEELSEFEKHLKNIGDLIEQGKWYEAGKELNTTLKELLEGIHWDDIKNKAAELGQGFAEFTNGLFEDEQLGYDIGQALVELINTAFTFLYNYLSNTNFSEIGEFLGQTVIGFFDNMDSDLIGKTIAEAFNKAIDFVKGFVDDMFKKQVFKDVPKDIDNGWKLVGYKISDIINKAIDDIDADEAADTLIRLIDGIFTTLGTFIENLDTKELKEKFRAFLIRAFNGFKEHSDDWAQTISEFVDFIIEMIDTFFETYDASGMREAIMTFLQNSKIGDLAWRLIEAKFQIKAELFIPLITLFLTSIKDKILEWGGGDLMGVLGSIYVFFTKWATGLFGWGARKLGEFLGDLYNECIETGTDIINSVVTFWSKIGATIKEKFENIKSTIKEKIDAIKEFFSPSKWLEIGKGAIQSLINGVKSIKFPHVEWDTVGVGELSIKVPKLAFAKGGIVTSPTNALIGEAGPEAVVPLKNNTEWIDLVASKVAGQINAGGGYTNTNPIIIDMSKATKQVYTRSEMLAFGREVAESLKLAGFVVSVNM